MIKCILLVFLSIVFLTEIANGQEENKPTQLSETAIRHYIYSKKYTHTIDGYQIKCDRSMVLVWGKPKKINISNPQESEATLIDLKKNITIKKFGLSSGTFGAGFLSNGEYLNIESGAGVTIDLSTYSEVFFDHYFDTEGKYEKCPAFKGQSFNKYTN